MNIMKLYVKNPHPPHAQPRPTQNEKRKKRTKWKFGINEWCPGCEG